MDWRPVEERGEREKEGEGEEREKKVNFLWFFGFFFFFEKGGERKEGRTKAAVTPPREEARAPAEVLREEERVAPDL